MADIRELLGALGLSPPVEGPITSVYGDLRSGGRGHFAGDVRVKEGTPIVAPTTVRVLAPFKGGRNMRANDWGVDVQEVGGQNRILKMVHTGDMSHLKPDMIIPAGQSLGVVGNVVDNPHLHFQVMDANRNPINWTGGTRQTPQPVPAKGGVPVATYDDKSNLIPSQAVVGETPGLADFISTLLRTGAVPTRAPLSNEAQPAPGPPPSERKGEILSGLGMLAGLGTPTQARVGEMITTLGQKESDRARATVAARNLGYTTPEEMAAAKEAAQVEGLQAAAALARINVPRGIAESIGTMYRTTTEKPVTITTKEGASFTIPSHEVPNVIDKFGHLQISNQELQLHRQSVASTVGYQAAMTRYAGIHAQQMLQDIELNKGIPAFGNDGKPIFNPATGKPLIWTAKDQLGLMQHNPAALNGQLQAQGFYHGVYDTLSKFGEAELKASQDPTGKMKKEPFRFKDWVRISPYATRARIVTSGVQFKIMIFTLGGGKFEINRVTAWMKLTDRRGFNTFGGQVGSESSPDQGT